MVTGRGDEKTAARALALGAAGYVVKNEDISSVLPETVRRVLQLPETSG
jgi:DNA-binding NarL/FixJ family response regulator